MASRISSMRPTPRCSLQSPLSRSHYYGPLPRSQYSPPGSGAAWRTPHIKRSGTRTCWSSPEVESTGTRTAFGPGWTVCGKLGPRRRLVRAWRMRYVVPRPCDAQSNDSGRYVSRLAFYGDDFTGSVDVLLQVARCGWSGHLFTSLPDPEDLRA